MAKTAAGSFSNYSGIDRHKAMQDEFSIPDAVTRQDPSIRETVRDTNPWALGLSERGATPSGRSWNDPGRQAERWVRGTGSQGQTRAAQAAQDFAEDADPVGAARKRAFGPRNRGILNQGPIVGFDVMPTQVPQTVGNPNAVVEQAPVFSPVPPANPFSAPPNIFSGTINPIAAQSRSSIGSAMMGGSITGYNPARATVPIRYY